METGGKERVYSVSTDERFPCLVVSDDGIGAQVTIPERLVKRLRDAEGKLTEAENDVVRWVKYSKNEQAKAELRTLIHHLPTVEQRKKERK